MTSQELRTIDTHIYQPAGRWIERVAMRFTISFLHPARIAQYIGEDAQGIYLPFYDSTSLPDAIAKLSSRYLNGSTVLAGLKGLKKQTQYVPPGSPTWKANRHHINMVLGTKACFIDAIMYNCLTASDIHLERFDMDLLKIGIAFRNLVLICGNALLPETFHYARDADLNEAVLPRKQRETLEFGEDVPLIESLSEAANDRTRRLLRSFDELEREARGCDSRINNSTSQFQIDADPHWHFISDFGDEWWGYWRSTFDRARRVKVQENDLTDEFRKARRVPSERDPSMEYGIQEADCDVWNWARYQLRHASRHKWGQYLCSSMDWDWNLATCMEYLFKIEMQTCAGPCPVTHSAPASSPTIELGVVSGETWTIQTKEGHGILPKEVKIAYKTENGETQYMSFIPAFISPGLRPVSEGSSAGRLSEECLEPMAVPQKSGYRIMSSGEEQEIEDLKTTGASFPDASQLEACDNTRDDTPVEESSDDCEGKEPVCGVGYDEVQTGEDTISICSLE